MLSGIAGLIFSSAWTWAIGGILSIVGVGYAFYRRYERAKLKRQRDEARWELKKKSIEEKARNEANKTIDNPFDFLSK